MPWTFFWNLGYLCLIVAVSPLLIYRRFVLGKYREGWSQKFLGRLPESSDQRPVLWLHAVSVGEVLQLEPVLDELRKSLPGWRFLISTTTATGRQVALKKYPQETVCFAPLDFSWSVARALRRVKPSAIVLVELEIWPNLLAIAESLNIPVMLINGRISQRSFRNYMRVRPLISRSFRRLKLAAVQNEEYATRMRQLGVPDERLHITGSIKFDRCLTDRNNPLTEELRRCYCIRPDETVFIAGSTQHPEEEIALDCYQNLKRKFPALRLILVPRHQERFDEVAEMVRRSGLPLIRRSAAENHAPQEHIYGNISPIGLLDTLGELSACWGLADLAFVGGSLTRRGGQNMIEPAACGAAVMFGPHTHNFKDVVELLLSHDAATRVTDENELRQVLGRLLERRESMRDLGKRARQLVGTQQGATRRTVELILPKCIESSKNQVNEDCNSADNSLSSNRAA